MIEIAVSDLDDKGAMVRHFRKLAGYLEQPDLRQSVKDDQSWFERAEDASVNTKFEGDGTPVDPT